MYLDDDRMVDERTGASFELTDLSVTPSRQRTSPVALVNIRASGFSACIKRRPLLSFAQDLSFLFAGD